MPATAESPYLAPMLWRLVAQHHDRRVPATDAGFVATSLRAALLDLLPAGADGGFVRTSGVAQVCALAVPAGDRLAAVGLAIPRDMRRDELAALREALKGLTTFGGPFSLGERVRDARLAGVSQRWSTLTPCIPEGRASRSPSDRRKRVRHSLRYALWPGYEPELARQRVAEIVESITVEAARDWPVPDDADQRPEHLHLAFLRPVTRAADDRAPAPPRPRPHDPGGGTRDAVDPRRGRV